jgi:hypothetical protein
MSIVRLQNIAKRYGSVEIRPIATDERTLRALGTTSGSEP